MINKFKILMPLGFVILLALVWEGFVRAFQISPILLPPPSRVVFFMIHNASWLLYHTGVTLYEAILGLAGGIFLGLTIGILIAYSKTLNYAILPLLVALNSTPLQALAPLILIMFGYGLLSKTVLVVLITFFPVVINTGAGLGSAQPELLDLAKSFKASNWQMFLKIKLPNALPYIFSGLKIAAPLSLVGAVIAELVGGNQGVGWVLMNAVLNVSAAQTLAIIILAGLAGIVLFQIAVIIEKRAIPWYKEERITTGVY